MSETAIESSVSSLTPGWVSMKQVVEVQHLRSAVAHFVVQERHVVALSEYGAGDFAVCSREGIRYSRGLSDAVHHMAGRTTS